MSATGPTIEHRDIRCRHSENLPALLTELRLSVLISTYQTGHLVVVAAHQGRLMLTFHGFDRAMGVAVKPGCISVCTRNEVWFVRSVPDITAKLEPRGQFDACFLARTAHYTGDIQAHESAWVRDEFWVVNTLFSCLAALHPHYSFAPRWMPPFVSALVPEDRCHLNGLALVEGQPRYVTALGETDTAAGWRAVKTTGGCLLEVPSGRRVAGGLSLPHSPRVDQGRIYLLSSGLGRLDMVDPESGQLTPVAAVPGVARGLALHGGHAFVGLSKARPSLEGVPIVAQREQLKCGLAIIALRTGSSVALLEFQTGVEEIFDVQVLPGITFPFISGPWAQQDTGQPLWTVPPQK
jgi:uncharacterized protein (TIGR03032 family)